MSPSSTTFLPTELIVEILSWLPVKLLVKFTCVSKLWKSFIFDPSFSTLHLQRSPKNTHVLFTLRDILNNDVDSWLLTSYSVRHLFKHLASTVSQDECRRFKYKTYEPVGSANGLVCLMKDNSHLQPHAVRKIWFRFWNPTLRLRSNKSPIMPNVESFDQVHCGFGYDDSTDTFKVVTVFWNSTIQRMEGRVHCMGHGGWRKTLACPDIPILLGTLMGQFVNGSVNWLALNHLSCYPYKWENVTIKQLVIFSFDLRKESCNYILLPDGFREVPKVEPTIAVLRGCLCLYYDHMKTHFVLWQMRQFGVQESWIRLVNVSYEHLQFNHFAPDALLLPLCLSENGDLMLLANKVPVDIIKYNSRDDRVEYIQLPNNQIWYADDHMQSLVLPLPQPH